ncbi:MAG: TIGR02757 family protein [Bacteroidota bacterium]|nr:TIGR02757 family protein [Bacteroidota bacterium]
MQAVEILLNEYLTKYYVRDFIVNDPISIPHQFSYQADIEISAFFSAIFAWGKRSIILNKLADLMTRMDGQPYQFIAGASQLELKQLDGFVHRTFQSQDLYYFVKFLRSHYAVSSSLETAFTHWRKDNGLHPMDSILRGFHKYFFSLIDAPQRTRKHIGTPDRNSACKRINLFLRWMVRQCPAGIDFGLWRELKMSELLMPVDVHVLRQAIKLNLLPANAKSNWKTTLELTALLQVHNQNDPVIYDFALFGVGVDV